MKLALIVDDEADAGYIALNGLGVVALTVPFGDSVLIDLDAAAVPVGIEILNLAAAVDVDGICDRYSLSDEARAELRRVLT